MPEQEPSAEVVDMLSHLREQLRRTRETADARYRELRDELEELRNARAKRKEPDDA